MSERKKYDPGLVRVGEMLKEKRKALGAEYKTSEHFMNSEILNYLITATGFLHVIWQILNLGKTGSVLKN